MIDFVRRVINALLLRGDFTSPLWKMDPQEARTWLILSVFADMLAQTIASDLTLATLLLALVLPAVLWRFPPRLAGGLGCLFLGQALMTTLLAIVLGVARIPLIIRDGVLVTWQLWCGVAVVFLILKYIRTPKSSMAK